MNVSQRSCVALIPARGGSKSIPRKNTKEFLGVPLLVHSIRTAKACKDIERVFVSTDSTEIADLARSHGAEVPFLRPASISADDSPDLPVFLHFLDWCREQGALPELVVHLRPTSPIRKIEDIQQSIEKMRQNIEADSLRAVIEPSQNPFKMWREREGYLIPFHSEVEDPFAEENYNKPRQSLPRVLWQTGYLDVIRTKTLLEKNSMTGRKILSFEIEPEYAFDLDSPFDWEWAEAFWQARLKSDGKN